MPDLVLVVRLLVRSDALDSFRRFERVAARVMLRHRGAIERVVVVGGEPTDSMHREVHLVRFPNDAALDAYRNDPDLQSALPLREASVITTTILAGEDGPNYHLPAG